MQGANADHTAALLAGWLPVASRAAVGKTAQLTSRPTGKETISQHLRALRRAPGHCIYGGIWVGEDSDIPNSEASATTCRGLSSRSRSSGGRRVLRHDTMERRIGRATSAHHVKHTGRRHENNTSARTSSSTVRAVGVRAVYLRQPGQRHIERMADGSVHDLRRQEPHGDSAARTAASSLEADLLRRRQRELAVAAA